MDESGFEEAFQELAASLGEMPDPDVAISSAELADAATVLNEAAQMLTSYLGIILALEEGEEAPSFPDAAIPIIESTVRACEELSDIVHNAICQCGDEEEEEEC